MGLYIPNMNLPQVCDEKCPCFEDSGLNGCDCKWDGVLQFPVKKGKHSEQCPLIEIATPHGDLIDRDKLLKDIDTFVMENEIGYSGIVHIARCAETVMSAEEE